MHAIKRKNPLTASFLAQLDVDLEIAGLDSLRLKQKDSSDSNLYTQNKDRVPPTYGDMGLAAFNYPTQYIVDDGNGMSNEGTDMSSKQFGLPNRQRTTPGAFIFEMDTSPNGSGGDQQLSGSASIQNFASSHTSSSTAYSPLQVDHIQLTGVLDPGNANGTFHPGYDMNGGVQQPGGAFIPPHNWRNGVQGVSTQGGGFCALSGSELGEVMAGMSDAEWDTVLDSMSGWDSGLDHGSMNVL